MSFLNTSKISLPSNHLNILISSMALGGAERIVLDTIKILGSAGVTVNLLILWKHEACYLLNNLQNVQVIHLNGLHRQDKLRTIALEVLSSSNSLIYTHLIRVRDLSYLWGEGITTIPVIHNSKMGWIDNPCEYNVSQVPFIISCCDAVAQEIRESDCAKPVITIRHEITRKINPEKLLTLRSHIRSQYQIYDDIFLIGMVGQFKTQKVYHRAVEILYNIQKYFPAKLMILGGWNNEEYRKEYISFCEIANKLQVFNDIILPGNIQIVEPYYSAFDVYLNTSDYEGLSIATLEAAQNGCPIVAADVGGQKEILANNIALIKSSDINGYVEAIRKIAAQPERNIILSSKSTDLIPKLWYLLSEYGTSDKWETSQAGTLFVINNLNLAGAQRSLTNLLCHPLFNHNAIVCTLDESLNDYYFKLLTQRGITVFTLHSETNLLKRVEKLLELVSNFKLNSICFWNTAPKIKLLISKILLAAPVKILDVSPGSMYFEELESTINFQQRISLTATQYLNRLNHLVVKYSHGLPPQHFGKIQTKTHIIPNGVLTPTKEQIFASRKLPFNINNSFAIGTCCRITSVKRIEWLIDVMSKLTANLPEASLTIVGGVHPKETDYWNSILQKLTTIGLKNVFFTGAVENVYPYLHNFKVFVMVSEPGGCPNASLEAMSMGLPVVATRYGGAIDQIQHGVNGFLVSRDNPEDMANQVEYLLRNPQKAQEMGQAALNIVRDNFSMELMVSRYLDILKTVEDGYN